MEKKKTFDLNTEFDILYIAQRLIEARHFRGLKQSSVAEAMGITQQAYSILENRRSGSIGFHTLLRFSKHRFF
jgi:transcriptional regulator with XRE-family HTH domain